MIPNIFISSTIDDLRYLREAIRDAVVELAYNPIMSESGGVGYIQQGRASGACYIAIKQCQLAVLIIGKRYGSLSEDGISVTHKEFLTAQENELPMITFVDSEVMHYKKVFDTDPNAPLWDKFPHMDQPKLTFAFLTDVMKAPTHNGLIEFSSASEVKQRLKQQIAHHMGDLLAGTIRPIKGDVSEILAEVKTLRNLISKAEEKKQAGSEIVSGSDRYYTALRFLLDERQREYTKFMEVLFGDLDLAVKHIVDSQSLDQVIKGAGATIETVPEDFDYQNLIGSLPVTAAPSQVRYMSKGQYGAWALLGGRRVKMTPMMREHLEQQQKALSAKLATKAKS
jgi:hypothetical protein